MNYLVTGGAGFIGSHVVDELIRLNNNVLVYDNLTTGHEAFIKHHYNNRRFRFIKADLLDFDALTQALEKIDFVFHMAAHADVKSGYYDHQIDHKQNLETTLSLLEAMYKMRVRRIAFASTSSVYGDAKIHPTPESYPFKPTSLYGSTKAACESYINAFSDYYSWQTYIFRFVSFIGERYTHGIIIDLLKKLKTKPKYLDLLSDGTPKKSSLYVLDGIKAMFTVINKSSEKLNIYNIGHNEILTVDDIVNTILECLKINIEKRYRGGKLGWKGDNYFVQLDIAKINRLKWKPTLSFKEAINLTTKYLLNNNYLL